MASKVRGLMREKDRKDWVTQVTQMLSTRAPFAFYTALRPLRRTSQPWVVVMGHGGTASSSTVSQQHRMWPDSGWASTSTKVLSDVFSVVWQEAMPVRKILSGKRAAAADRAPSHPGSEPAFSSIKRCFQFLPSLWLLPLQCAAARGGHLGKGQTPCSDNWLS